VSVEAEATITETIRESSGRRRTFFIAFLSTMAIFFAIAETAVPKPLPWMRLGLANSITLYALSTMRVKEALIIVVARVIAASLLIGTFLSIGFILSLTGALASFVVMCFFYSIFKRWISLVGISVLGAVTSNASQLFVVNTLFVNSRLSYYFLPFLFLFALTGGTVSGLFGRFLVRNI